jgi:hypothetical protein
MGVSPFSDKQKMSPNGDDLRWSQPDIIPDIGAAKITISQP